MKVILKEDVSGVGIAGDLVDVKDGYGRNFLVPKGLAVLADPRNRKRFEHEQRIIAHQQARVLGTARSRAEALDGLAISIKRQAGEESDKLFGSVTNRDIAEALAAEGVEVDRRSIELHEPIHSVGIYQVPVRLHREVTASVKVYVIRE